MTGSLDLIAQNQGHSARFSSPPDHQPDPHTLDPGRSKDAQQQSYEENVARSQAKWLELSSNAKQLFTDKSSEYIPFDQPTFVIDAIREVYTQSKQ